MMFGYKPAARPQPAPMQNAAGHFVKDSFQDLGRKGASATLRTLRGDVTVTMEMLHRKSEFKAAALSGAKVSAFGDMSEDRSTMKISSMTTEDDLKHIRGTPFEQVARQVEVDRMRLTAFSGQVKKDSYDMDRHGRSSITLETAAGPLKVETSRRDIARDIRAASESGGSFSIAGSLAEGQGRVSLVARRVGAAPVLEVEDPFAAQSLDNDRSATPEPAM